MPLAEKMTTKVSIWVSAISFESGLVSLFTHRVRQSIHWILCLFCCLPAAVGATDYLTREDFLNGAFSSQPPAPKTLWLRGELRKGAEKILGHRYAALRIRYWRNDDQHLRTVWILDEIGKELPITTGIVVDGTAIESVQLLAFRESRGGEVRYPAFTRQFNGLSLTQDGYLSGHVDGISGATLSVSALKRLSRLALYFHSYVTNDE